MQFRCVHVAENARSSPDGVRTRMPARFPNLKISAEFAARSLALIGRVTDEAADSADAGGMM